MARALVPQSFVFVFQPRGLVHFRRVFGRAPAVDHTTCLGVHGRSEAAVIREKRRGRAFQRLRDKRVLQAGVGAHAAAGLRGRRLAAAANPWRSLPPQRAAPARCRLRCHAALEAVAWSPPAELQHSSGPGQADSEGWTPLHLALRLGAVALLRGHSEEQVPKRFKGSAIHAPVPSGPSRGHPEELAPTLPSLQQGLHFCAGRLEGAALQFGGVGPCRVEALPLPPWQRFESVRYPPWTATSERQTQSRRRAWTYRDLA
eukprot:scaffold300_cov258-Pinguiococcus_pyrenoidosus.AAC.21